MVVQHNLTAMNSNRMLNITTKSQADSAEKLSSGYKINRAADDAAGLSISEKMRKQIRGLTQASSNAQDGISCVQTAEGALNEVQDMLQRMNELSVKAANGTNSTDDRTYIQNEIDQLVSEIDRVAETTKFNETYLLKGDSSKTRQIFSYAPKTTAAATTVIGTAGANTGSKLTITFAAPTNDDEVTAQNELAAKIKEKGYSCSTDANKVATYTLDGYEVKGGLIKKDGVTIASYAEAGTLSGSKTDAKIPADLTDVTTTAAVFEHIQYYDPNGNRIPENALDNFFSYNGSAKVYDLDKKLYDGAGNVITPVLDDINFENITGDLTLKLHVGADATSNNQISVSIRSLTAKGIGVKGLRVDGTDDTNARHAIDTIKESIQKISTQRSALGAVQNRLDHTINNLDNVVENTTSAESSIRDTDMATEMVRYSNNNILAQAGQAMLAQSNQANQGVLSLLQ